MEPVARDCHKDGRMLSVKCLVTLAVVFSTSFLADAVTLTFKEKAFVKGPAIRLGELAEIEGDETNALTDLEIGPAAPPQNSRQLNTDLIVARIKNAGVDTGGLDVKGPSVVQATTMHQEISSEVITESLQKYIEEHVSCNAEDANIELAVNVQPVIVPEGEVVFDWRPDAGYRYLGTGTFRGSLAVDGRMQKTLLCKATIEVYGSVLVAASNIPRGQALDVTNVEIQKLPLSTLRDGVIAADAPADQVLQLVARRDIAKGDVLTKALVAPRVIVKRRQMVTVETLAGGIQVRTQARAESDGAEGDVVVCTNLNSKQAFQGIVRRDGTVVVSQ